MQRLMKNRLLTAVLGAVVVLIAAGSVDAQGLKIGFVKDSVIIAEYTVWQKAQEQWELEKTAWDEEAISKQDELIELQEEFDKQKLILSEVKKKERQAAINAKRDALDAYTRQVFGPNGLAERKYGELVEPLVENIQKAIEGVAVEGNYDVIFTLQSIGYIKDSYDVTDKVLNYLEELEE